MGVIHSYVYTGVATVLQGHDGELYIIDKENKKNIVDEIKEAVLGSVTSGEETICTVGLVFKYEGPHK